MADYNDKNHLLHLDGTGSTAGPDVENEEPCGAGVSAGGAIGEARRLCLRLVLSAFEIALGQSASHSCHSACHCARGVSHVEV